jgi:hypothetical protein
MKKYTIILAGKFYKKTSNTSIQITGNDAVWDEEAQGFRYVKGGELLSVVGKKPCPKCGGDPNDYDGQDPCIAHLPGVKRACCGHGKRRGEILFSNGVKIRGKFDISRVEIPAHKRVV